MYSKKLVCILVAAVASLTVLSGCGKSVKISDSSDTIDEKSSEITDAKPGNMKNEITMDFKADTIGAEAVDIERMREDAYRTVGNLTNAVNQLKEDMESKDAVKEGVLKAKAFLEENEAWVKEMESMDFSEMEKEEIEEISKTIYSKISEIREIRDLILGF